MTLERKNQDEALDDYLDDSIIDLMDNYSIDRDMAEEVYTIMNDLDVESEEALAIYKRMEQSNGNKL